MIPHSDAADEDRRVLEGEHLFLCVLLESADGTATLADATPPEYRYCAFPDGGRWRGAIPRRLRGRGIVGAVCGPSGIATNRSTRTARREGLGAVWQLIDRGAAKRRLADLEAILSRATKPAPRQQPTLLTYCGYPAA